MVKSKRCVFYLPERLVKIIDDITPLFYDSAGLDPLRGAMTRALEYILQEYMSSEDYAEKSYAVKRLRWNMIVYMSDKEKQRLEKLNYPKS